MESRGAGCRRAVDPVPQPDAEIWQGDLGGFVKVGEGHGDVALLGPVIRNPNGTIYESGRPSRGPTSCRPRVLGPSAWQPFHTRLPADELGSEYRARGRLGERRRHADPAVCARAGGRVRRDVRAVRGGVDLCTRLRNTGWKVLATPELEVMHVGGVSTGRSPDLPNALAEYLPLLSQASGDGWRRDTAVGVGGAPGTRELVALRYRVKTHRERITPDYGRSDPLGPSRPKARSARAEPATLRRDGACQLVVLAPIENLLSRDRRQEAASSRSSTRSVLRIASSADVRSRSRTCWSLPL